MKVLGSQRPNPAQGLYAISVAAQLAGLGPRTLRLYERKGLLKPQRTNGGTRQYSDDDIARLRRIAELVDAGVNLTGIGIILERDDEIARLREHLDRPPGTHEE